MELLSAQLQEEASEECGIPPDVARFLATSFQNGCGAVLTLATGSASSDEVRIVNLTDVSKHKEVPHQVHETCVAFRELYLVLDFQQ